MCGRYVLKQKDLEVLMEQLGVKDVREFASRFNIPPSTRIPAVRTASSGRREEVRLQWGLVPRWAKTATGGAGLANARADGIASKPAFQEAFRRRRCVVPASGFYEWQTLGRAKHPWYFQMRDAQPFVFAGLWETWRSPDGVELETCSLITTTPNAVVRPLHDRMPVILQGEKIDAWLAPTITQPAQLETFLAPLPDDAITATPVSPRVNSVSNEGPECLEVASVPSFAAAREDNSQLSLGL